MAGNGLIINCNGNDNCNVCVSPKCVIIINIVFYTYIFIHFELNPKQFVRSISI